MSYLIKNSNGELIVEIYDGTADGPDVNAPSNHTDLNLIGRNYPSYGSIQNENFIKLLENFSKNTAPAKPIKGQLWYDSSVDRLKVYNGTTFKYVSSMAFTASTATPSGSTVGDQWWDINNQQLKSYNGTNWTTVGPPYSALDGISGAIPDSINGHPVVKLYAETNLIAIFSWDSAFTPNPAISGFSTSDGKIYPGLNINNLNSGVLNGTAFDSNKLGGISSSDYARTDIEYETFNGNINIGSSNGLQIRSNPGNMHVYFRNVMPTGDFSFYVTKSDNTSSRVLYLEGSTSEARVTAAPVTYMGIANKQYVDDNITNELLPYAKINSPAFTGTPTSVTPPPGNNSTRIATTAFTNAAIASSTDAKWQGSAKYIRSSAPTTAEAAAADVGDFWFQI